jgi:SagB-type dehydrogenase family enzyme
MAGNKTPRTFDELTEGPRHPVSALFHENTKLAGRRVAAFLEGMAEEIRPSPPKTYPTRKSIALPRPRRPILGTRLDDALAKRRSPRGAFGTEPIGKDVLGAVLHEALGPTESLRAWPSAGGLYPLEFYVIAVAADAVPAGVYHYDATAHALASLGPCPPPEVLRRVILAEAPPAPNETRPVNRWDTAAFALVVTAVFERTQRKYGERGYRFVLLDAGHAAQNVLLSATARDLAALPLGGFCEDELGDLLELDRARESPIHALLLGARPRA